MQVQVDIPFDDILKIVKNLPANQLSILKKEIENGNFKVDKYKVFENKSDDCL